MRESSVKIDTVGNDGFVCNQYLSSLKMLSKPAAFDIGARLCSADTSPCLAKRHGILA